MKELTNSVIELFYCVGKEPNENIITVWVNQLLKSGLRMSDILNKLELAKMDPDANGFNGLSVAKILSYGAPNKETLALRAEELYLKVCDQIGAACHAKSFPKYDEPTEAAIRAIGGKQYICDGLYGDERKYAMKKWIAAYVSTCEQAIEVSKQKLLTDSQAQKLLDKIKEDNKDEPTT